MLNCHLLIHPQLLLRPLNLPYHLLLLLLENFDQIVGLLYPARFFLDLDSLLRLVVALLFLFVFGLVVLRARLLANNPVSALSVLSPIFNLYFILPVAEFAYVPLNLLRPQILLLLQLFVSRLVL